nr:hypothetical protein CFP56_19807 [Quercus suber]
MVSSTPSWQQSQVAFLVTCGRNRFFFVGSDSLLALAPQKVFYFAWDVKVPQVLPEVAVLRARPDEAISSTAYTHGNAIDSPCFMWQKLLLDPVMREAEFIQDIVNEMMEKLSSKSSSSFASVQKCGFSSVYEQDKEESNQAIAQCNSSRVITYEGWDGVHHAFDNSTSSCDDYSDIEPEESDLSSYNAH